MVDASSKVKPAAASAVLFVPLKEESPLETEEPTLPGAWPAAVAADGSLAAWSQARWIPEPLAGLTSCWQSLLKLELLKVLPMVLPLGAWDVAVPQLYEQGMEEVACIGQPWS